jgi:amino acid adenylation domain-containing protein
MNFIDVLKNTFERHSLNNAFFINETYHTYKDVATLIAQIRQQLQEQTTVADTMIGLVTHNEMYSYAAIIALWLEGKAYIPISPDAPVVRNTEILQSTNSTYVIDTSSTSLYSADFKILSDKSLKTPKTYQLDDKSFNPEALAYVLFTSGSTGKPKGVPITFSNLNSLITAIQSDTHHDIFPDDKCLQMFELTFDFSLVTFLYPLLHGACVYTIPKNQIKYLYIYKLILEHGLTYLVMTPSIINYLQPYFDEIDAQTIRYCCFGAAPLHLEVLLKWKKCIPNASLFNSYGPTEYTVTTSYYNLSNTQDIQTKNGVVAIGTPMQNVDAIIIDDNQNLVPLNTPGELCLAGKQLTSGYWNNPEQNNAVFFEKHHGTNTKRFYKTGDLCTTNETGVISFIGRKDFQVKIQGYRIELGEIEFHIRAVISETNFTVIDIAQDSGNKDLFLVVETTKDYDFTAVIDHLKKVLPAYMVPKYTACIAELPHNTNGKLDRNTLKTYLKNL